MGVPLFYILSAFTLFRSYSYRDQIERFPKLNFFIRRFFRIAPLYYLAIIYYLWQEGFGSRYWLGNIDHVSTFNVISNFLFIHGFNPYYINSVVPGGWSVGIECIFYACFPLLFYYIKNIQQAFNFVLISVLFRTVLLIFFKHYPLINDERLWGEYLYFYFPNQLLIFSLGIFAYFIVDEKSKNKLSISQLSRPAFLCFIVLLMLETVIHQELFISTVFTFGISIVLLIIFLHNRKNRFISNPVLQYIGNVSYTIYLTHYAAIFIANKFRWIDLIQGNNQYTALISFVVNYLIILSISIGFSTILYFFIELPMQRFGKSIIQRINKSKIITSN